MKVLITGVNGLLGKDIAKVFAGTGEYQVCGVGRAECYNKEIKYCKVELTDYDQVSNLLKDYCPDIIIHCAAYTKLDDCEKNQEYAKKINVEVTEYLAKSAKYFVYISSDSVFSGEKGNYVESDASDAVNYYGHTKYLGELAARNAECALIIRSSIYGYNLNDNQSIAEWGARNLMAGKDINGFGDVIFNPLYSVQLAKSLLYLVKNGYTGIVHLGAKQVVSKYEFFCMLAKMLEVDEAMVHKASVKSVKFLAQRTLNTSLQSERIHEELSCYNDLYEGMRQLICDMKEDNRI